MAGGRHRHQLGSDVGAAAAAICGIDDSATVNAGGLSYVDVSVLAKDTGSSALKVVAVSTVTGPGGSGLLTCSIINGAGTNVRMTRNGALAGSYSIRYRPALANGSDTCPEDVVVAITVTTARSGGACAWMHKPPVSILPALDSDIPVWDIPAAGASAPAVASARGRCC